MADPCLTRSSHSSQPVKAAFPHDGYVPARRLGTLAYKLRRLVGLVENMQAFALQLEDIKALEPDGSNQTGKGGGPEKEPDVRAVLETIRILLDSALKPNRQGLSTHNELKGPGADSF